MKKGKVKVNSIFRTYILAQLHEKPQCGYDLMLGFKESTGKSPSHGILYPFLHELAKNNYVIEKLEEGHPRLKKVYHLTKDGEEFAKSIFRSLEFVVTKFLSNCAHCEREYFNPDLDNRTIFCCSECETDNNSQ